MKCPLCESSLDVATGLLSKHFVICSKKKPMGDCSYALGIDEISGLQDALAKGVKQILDDFEMEEKTR